MDKALLKKLLEKYSQDACSPEEAAVIESWLAAIKNDGLNLEKHPADEDLLRVKNNINNYITPDNQKANTKFTFLSMAASIVLIAGILGWLFLKPLPAIKVNESPVTRRYTKNGLVYIETSKGVRQEVDLPDGSRVTMDAATRFHYPLKFNDHVRPVYLDEGQALFNVAKNPKSPFTVYTKKFATTALGTAFNIRNYAIENKVSISLIHGRIRIDDLQSPRQKTPAMFLSPHQQLVLYKPTETLSKTEFKEDTPVLSWTTGILYFKDAGAAEVLNTIDNKFNVLIVNRSSHLNWSYTGVFKNESLTDVLKTICLTEGITYTINKQTITLN